MPTSEEWAEQSRLYAVAAGQSAAGLDATVQVVEQRKNDVTTLADAMIPASAQAIAAASVATSTVNQAAAAALQGRLRIDDATTYASISPAATWNGTAGTGFVSTPIDPTRTTAKPAMRLLVPPAQAFTDYLVVGVAAWANNAGVLDNGGLKQVTFYYEGGQTVVSRPSYYSFPDVNGKTVTYFGWWCALLHNGINGEARLYVEATPKDGTMQNRVLGPFSYLPSATLYDLELTVAPSLPQIVGSRYQSIRNALNYAAAQGKNRPRILITEQRDDYLLEQLNLSPFTYSNGKGYATIEASVPVTIIGTTTYADATPRTKYDGLHFKGSNITLDFKTMSYIYWEGNGTVNNRHWFDGVNITNSGGRSYVVPELRGPRIFGVCRGGGFFTENTISYIPSTVGGALLARGNSMSGGFYDGCSEAQCVIGNRINDYDAYDSWAKDTNAFTVTYTGGGATATLELSGFSDAASRTFTAKVGGVSVGTLTVTKAPPTAVSTVVNWLNTLSGWSAALQSDLIRANLCSIPNNIGGAFGPTNVKDVTLQIVTFLDAHGDFYQTNLPANTPENVVIADNVVTNWAGQGWFFSTTTQLNDFAVVNNAFYEKPIPGWTFLSQWGRASVKSHIVMAHNSSSQQLWIRVSQGTDPDAYCLVANNAISGIVWEGTPDAQVRIANNHYFAGSSVPSGDINGTVGGDTASLWQSAPSGDFTPKGALLTNLKLPAIARDYLGKRRSRTEVAGSAI